MASTLPPNRGEQMSNSREGGLDVDWLLRSQKESSSSSSAARTKSEPFVRASPKLETTNPVPKPKDDLDTSPTSRTPKSSMKTETLPSLQVNGTSTSQAGSTGTSEPKAPQTPPTSQQASKQTPPSKAATPEENKQQSKNPIQSLKKEGRKGSWLSSLGSKLSSSSSHSKGGGNNDAQANRKSPQPSPRFEPGNPFDKKAPKDDKGNKEEKVYVPQATRRPSVLVAAGTETKLGNEPGFLTSALRRLSSSNTAHMGKGAGSGAICPRKVMNIDQNRERTKISEFDQNKLRRVAFKVDVEIAGIAAQAEEQHEQPTALSPPKSQAGQAVEIKDSKLAKHKDMSEGAALKNSQSMTEEKEQTDAPKAEVVADAKAKEEVSKEKSETPPNEGTKQEGTATEGQTEPTTTRKKEKKKRSEAERKERKERKRRHAQANGLIPLELTRDDDDDSDSSPSNTPAGASTPRKDQPTVDPLRIYKRCCQLRETTALATIKEQISKPAATLAEAPGTVSLIDLSGQEISLQDITTIGDWLAVVPVRKLILDDCNLSDEAIRIILSGLSSCKNQEQAKANRKLPRRGSGKSGVEEMGVIEKLSLKNNSAISSIGWKHIALFMHMSRSLRAIDLSGIPFPARASGELSRTSTTTTSTTASSTTLTPDNHSRPRDLAYLIAKALAERFGTKLEELILSNCDLTSQAISDIVDSAIKCKIKRLGLAHNSMNDDALEHIIRYVTSGVCEGLDMGGNNLKGCGHLLTEVLDESNPLFALSLADTQLTTDDLNACMNHFGRLKNFKFIDLSRNKNLFTAEKNSVPVLRKYLPKMSALKRIHLADVGMTPDQLIALAEVFPDCPSLAHISILDNQPLVDAMNSPKSEDQEEACAYFVSLMTAVRASRSIIAIEIEVPSHDSSEVVRALASQVVAYSLRNLESTTMNEVDPSDEPMPERLDKEAPEVLLHLVGHMGGYSENHDNDDPAPDEDYMIASTGIVKALGVCLTNRDSPRTQSRNISPSASGTATPKHGGLKPLQHKKPKDVSLELCESARKIRLRLRPALVKEDKAGNIENYRRLLGLDQTLERMIHRFEDEYPESKRTPVAPPVLKPSSTQGTEASTEFGTNEGLDRMVSADDEEGVKLSRTSSHTSLAARVLTQEEGRMHKFGQSLRREILKPTGTDDVLHGTSSQDAPEAEHLTALRERYENVGGQDIRDMLERDGPEAVLKEINMNAKELQALEHNDPEGFKAFRDAQLAAQINSGYHDGHSIPNDSVKNQGTNSETKEPGMNGNNKTSTTTTNQ